MTVETAVYINSLDANYPASSDAKSEGDNHIRQIKAATKLTWANVTGAVTPTHTELNFVDGVTSAIQTQLDAKAPSDSPTFTTAATLPAATSIGTVSAAELLALDGVTSAIQTQLDAKAPLASPALTGTPTAPTATAGTNSTQIASTAFVATQAFSTALPAQTGNAGKFVTTDGTAASWAAAATLTGTQTLTNKTITETVYAITGTTPAFTATNGAVQTWTLSAASTPTNSLATGQSIILVITPVAYAITWPSVVWTKQGGSGAAPTLFTAGKTSVVLWMVGAVLYGSHLGDTA